MERSDEELIQGYLDGDRDAFAVLVERYLRSIYNFTYRLTSDAAAAEDITQDTFLKMWKNIKKYRTGGNVKSWVFAIAHNTAIDHLRKKKEFIFSDLGGDDEENSFVDTLADEEPLVDEILARGQDKEMLEGALATLAPYYREVILLRYQEELTFDEIGSVLDRPLHTVKSQHRRALQKLRGVLNAPK